MRTGWADRLVVSVPSCKLRPDIINDHESQAISALYLLGSPVSRSVSDGDSEFTLIDLFFGEDVPVT